MLQLRQALDPWRRQEPPKTIVALPSAQSRRQGIALRVGRLLSLASAALLGGVLVAGGFFLGGRFGVEQPAVPIARQPVVIVTPEQRHEIARAFALHESVAGPLSWYAADDSTIQVAPAQKGESLRQPIAVVLRLTRDLSCPSGEATPPKTYVIVCRNNDAAAIELPQSAVAQNRSLAAASHGNQRRGEPPIRHCGRRVGPRAGRSRTGRPPPRRPRPNLLGATGPERPPGERRCQRLGDRDQRKP